MYLLRNDSAKPLPDVTGRRSYRALGRKAHVGSGVRLDNIPKEGQRAMKTKALGIVLLGAVVIGGLGGGGRFGAGRTSPDNPPPQCPDTDGKPTTCP